jgi:probable rRNA maturation factor
MKTSNIQITQETHGLGLTKPLADRFIKNAAVFLEALNQADRQLSIYFCSRETSRRLNFDYRGIDAPTDVLSWCYDEETETEIPEATLWGELVFCRPVIEEHAILTGWSLEAELLRLLAHGILHLHGHDHSTAEEEAAMLSLETALLAKIGLQNPYGEGR